MENQNENDLSIKEKFHVKLDRIIRDSKKFSIGDTSESDNHKTWEENSFIGKNCTSIGIYIAVQMRAGFLSRMIGIKVKTKFLLLADLTFDSSDSKNAFVLNQFGEKHAEKIKEFAKILQSNFSGSKIELFRATRFEKWEGGYSSAGCDSSLGWK